MAVLYYYENKKSMKFSAYVMLGAKHSSTVFYKEISGGSGDAITYVMRIMGAADIDHDGNLDILTFTKSFEHQVIDVYISQKNGLKHIQGNWSGC